MANNKHRPTRSTSYDKKVGLVLQGGGVLGVLTGLGGRNLHWCDQCRDYRRQRPGAPRAAFAQFLGGHNRNNQDVAICSGRTAGGMAKSSERADNRDVRPARLFQTAPATGLVFPQ